MLDSAPGQTPQTPQAPIQLARRNRLVVMSWAVLFGFLSVAIWSRRWLSDDGFINLRVVENLVAGNGPVFNVGERVEAGTSQIWLAVLAVGEIIAGTWLDIEWIAVALGMICSLLTVGVVMVTQRRVWASAVLPVGIIGWLPLSSVWDFSTSGLETPLLWLWLASCYGLLAIRASGAGQQLSNRTRIDAAPDPARRYQLGIGPSGWWLPLLIGLGPLIRPDASLYSAAFFLAFVLMIDRTLRSVLSAVAAALAIPLAYQVFRAGYFGVLVPNTAIAKEAGEARWGEGFAYLKDFLAGGWLWVPFVAVVAAVVLTLRSQRVCTTLQRLWIITWLAAAAHTLWVIRVGGDFMHGRMLLANWLLFLLPVAALPTSMFKGRRLVGAVGVLVLWCLMVGAFIRPPFRSTIAPGVVDERTFYVLEAHVPNPVTIGDHQRNRWTDLGRDAQRRQRSGHDEVIFHSQDGGTRRIRSIGGTYLVYPNIGMMAFAAGSRVHVVDTIGLADPLAARSESLNNGRVGHSKELPFLWVEARFGEPGDYTTPQAAKAAQVLECDTVRELIQATTAPLSAAQFISNIVNSPRMTTLRIPNDPSEAHRQLC